MPYGGDCGSVHDSPAVKWFSRMSARNCPEHNACEGKIIQRIAQKYRNKSNNARNIDRKRVAIRKFFRSDVERIERVGAVGAVFEECSFSAGYESGKPMTSDSASFSLFFLNPFLPRLTPAAWMDRIRSSLFCRLKNGIRRRLPADQCLFDYKGASPDIKNYA